MDGPWPRGLLASGASVSLWDTNEALLKTTAEELSMKGRLHIYTANVADPDSVQRAADNTAQAFGRIDILVANAGITGPNVKCWEYPPEAWQQVIQVNLNGVFHCCRSVVTLHAETGVWAHSERGICRR